MAHREILMLLIFTVLASAKPFDLGIFDFGVGGGGGLQIGFGIDWNAEAPTTTESPEKEDEDKPPVPDSNPLDIFIDCSDPSQNLLKCVLRANLTLPEIKARPFPASPKNTPIPTSPPKGMPADVKDLQVKGSLADFIGKLQVLLGASLGLGAHLKI